MNPNCKSVYLVASGAWGNDVVRCQKPHGHKNREHMFTYSSYRDGQYGKERWTDAEALPADDWRALIVQEESGK